MKKHFVFGLLYLVIAGVSCKNNTELSKDTSSPIDVTATTPKPTKAEHIITNAIAAHGGDLYEKADYSFVFRKKHYRFVNNGTKYTYEVQAKKDGSSYLDKIVDGTFSRTKEGIPQELSEEDILKYSEALNSVIYFATLPHKLKDKAVHKKYIDETSIKNKRYDVVEITFSQDGGGIDFDDEYYYWINKETHKIDYLAYNYQVNGGGVRFREAYNSRVFDGITFQDYVNYKAPVGTALKDLPTLFETESLKEASRIITENVTNNSH